MLNATVPPRYGAHELDELYSDMDPLGYVTPAGDSTGLNTPFASNSRSASVDDLVAAGGQAPRGWVANILQIRLQPLIESGDPDQGHLRQFSDDENSMRRGGSTAPTVGAPSPIGIPSDHENPMSRGGSAAPTADAPLPIATPPAIMTPQIASSSATVNARPAETVSTATPTHVGSQQIEFSKEALCKVPSYRTARNSRPPVPVRDGLPNYESAVHAPIVVPVVSRPVPSDPRPDDKPPKPAP